MALIDYPEFDKDTIESDDDEYIDDPELYDIGENHAHRCGVNAGVLQPQYRRGDGLRNRHKKMSG